jgi:hypothetical protein
MWKLRAWLLFFTVLSFGMTGTWIENSPVFNSLCFYGGIIFTVFFGTLFLISCIPKSAKEKRKEMVDDLFKPDKIVDSL